MKEIKNFIDYIGSELNLSENTLEGYEYDIRQFFEATELSDPREITKHSIRRFVSYLAREGMASSTRNRKLSAISSFCRYLYGEEGILSENPASGIKRPKLEQRLPQFLNEDDISKIIESIDNPRDKVILELLYGLGLRACEIVEIKLKDIDFSNIQIRVIGKYDKQRVVPINGSALRAVIEYIGHLDLDSDEYLLPSPRNKNKPLTTRSVYNIVSKYAEASGVKDVSGVNVSPHKFRHSCATHLLANGMDLRYIQELLGHSNINTTTIYTKVIPANMSKSYHLAHPRD